MLKHHNCSYFLFPFPFLVCQANSFRFRARFLHCFMGSRQKSIETVVFRLKNVCRTWNRNEKNSRLSYVLLSMAHKHVHALKHFFRYTYCIPKLPTSRKYSIFYGCCRERETMQGMQKNKVTIWRSSVLYSYAQTHTERERATHRHTNE